jgi:hypothetical protein
LKRLAIERLELDLRGVPHEAAAAAARQIGPALARALAGRRVSATPAPSIDAGRAAIGAAPSADAIATRVAQQIAGKMSRGRS